MSSMFIRIAKQKRGDKVYRHLQIAESFRDPAKGKEPRTRIIAQLGTIEGLGEEQIEKLIAGLQRAIGKEPSAPAKLLFGPRLWRCSCCGRSVGPFGSFRRPGSVPYCRQVGTGGICAGEDAGG